MTIQPKMTPREKQQIWLRKQVHIFYGSGRPVFKITEHNQYERRNYDCKYYADSYKLTDLHNKNFIAIKNKNLSK